MPAEQIPQKIISLVPSQTELLYDLGLREQVIGITKFCVHPDEWFRTKERIGGTKNINIEKILALHPDLVIANKEENVREQVEGLAHNVPVHVTDVNNLAGALQMITTIGSLTGTPEKASRLVKFIEDGFKAMHTSKPSSYKSCVYLIWKDPYMTVGGDTFISDMLTHCGFKNVFANLQRYPVVTADDIANSGCDCVLMSSEPYPFKEQHRQQLMQMLPGVSVHLVDGEIFSWYGSRLQFAPAYFTKVRANFNDL